MHILWVGVFALELHLVHLCYYLPEVPVLCSHQSMPVLTWRWFFSSPSPGPLDILWTTPILSLSWWGLWLVQVLLQGSAKNAPSTGPCRTTVARHVRLWAVACHWWLVLWKGLAQFLPRRWGVPWTWFYLSLFLPFCRWDECFFVHIAFVDLQDSLGAVCLLPCLFLRFRRQWCHRRRRQPHLGLLRLVSDAFGRFHCWLRVRMGVLPIGTYQTESPLWLVN